MLSTSTLRISGLVFSTFLGASAAFAAQPHTDVILVRASCGSLSAPDCFTGANALAQAIEEVHAPSPGRLRPSSTNHVVVDIGPGTWNLDLTAFSTTVYGYCDGTNAGVTIEHLTYRGAGKTSTILTGGGWDNGGSHRGSNFAMLIQDCNEFAVEDLTLRALDGGTTELGMPVGVQSGVLFSGDGETYWRRMKIEASAMAWYDGGSSAFSASTHFWWDSTLRVVYANGCTSLFASVIYGGRSTHTFHHSVLELNEVDATLGPPGCQSSPAFAIVYLSAGYAVHAYDTSFTFYTFDPSPSPYGFFLGTIGSCNESGSVLEGSRNTIKLRSPTGSGATATNVIGIRSCGGKIELEKTTWDLAAVNQKTRILNVGGTLALRPNHNGSGTTPPSIENTVAGAETFTETDCGSVCGSAGSEPHVLGFDISCNAGGGPWYDQTANVCRQ